MALKALVATASTGLGAMLAVGMVHAQTTTYTGPERVMPATVPVRTQTSTSPITNRSFPTPIFAFYDTTYSVLKTKVTPTVGQTIDLSSSNGVYYAKTIAKTWGTPVSPVVPDDTPVRVAQETATGMLGNPLGTTPTTTRQSVACPPDPVTFLPLPIIRMAVRVNAANRPASIGVVCATTGWTGQTTDTPVASGIGWIGPNDPALPWAYSQCDRYADGTFTLGSGLRAWAGDVVDKVALECAKTGSHAPGGWAGSGGGSLQNPALCPKGYVLTGLTGWISTYVGNPSIIALRGACTVYPTNTGLGAAQSNILSYKGKSSKGAVSFRMQSKHGRAIGATKAGWDYDLTGFSFAKGCAKTVTVPGKVAVFARERATEKTAFSLPGIGASVAGTLSGSLAKPKVSGALKLLTGACKGRTLRFTATASR